MKIQVILLGIGILFGIIDVLPMVKKKLDKFDCSSAFIFHFIMPTILYYLNINISKIVMGGLLYVICALPMVIIVSKSDRKSAPIIVVSSFIIGTICGTIVRFL
ncbi:hypothetical protein [Sebaldella sp. S0638]|uniref:hypothetical protein n=1 Tax=Sebaldella sp. S0638 TaxID=2957809 RepID=UPI0020A1CEAA|nr:hypothetical protein [Sebaldella sp. S0638]MCP1223887.1 hypothetical protein [Sebaldella sp. S0638]